MWHDMSRKTADALNDGQDMGGGHVLATSSVPNITSLSWLSSNIKEKASERV